MGAVITNLLSGGAGTLMQGAATLVDAIKGKNPADAAALQALLEKHADLVTQTDADLATAKINEDVSLNATASSNIVAEAKGDAFTRDARPAVIWVGLLILFLNYGIISLIPPRWGYKPAIFPDLFWQVWGICVTGYVCARSADKLFGGAGGSATLPFGIKLDSKGD
jgi:hypothetical protein